MGITGKVFKSGEIYYTNRAEKDAKFTPEIDNLTQTTDIISCMIAPVYGHKSKDPRPNGIIQLMNKSEIGKITDWDKVRYLDV